ncbi:MAG: phosphate ABC transporter ATP-binding protein [Polaromonas sp.]|uniref:ABC transporter ATP-binding protein n=1 Tax=Polaromonas sp. TaxID=1869339 RepID=UPI00272377A9|nr:phosphate ABC transporter ATP-binding protein [Polaromonas sp.]MDO9114906.1 phosphate ABC transporter ATP-binding protein [Polaromonas sp.]MDP1888374.1 phosphate ABC transporter ATP-binding protein [Polaromonas sp.]
MSALFELKAVDVHFRQTRALAGCALCIHAGERVALVGANGSGKSTLLRTLHGLVPPTRGTVSSDPSARQAMVFQRPYMLRASALNNVALGLWLRGVPWKDAKAQALPALARVGLTSVSHRNAKALSGGQQQRLALARAWALQPQVLLLDEPTASLDPGAKRDVEALMTEFADAGMTLVFSSHNLGQVKRLASRVIYLEHGRLLADRPTHDFFNGPLPLEAGMFVKGELV